MDTKAKVSHIQSKYKEPWHCHGCLATMHNDIVTLYPHSRPCLWHFANIIPSSPSLHSHLHGGFIEHNQPIRLKDMYMYIHELKPG